MFQAPADSVPWLNLPGLQEIPKSKMAVLKRGTVCAPKGAAATLLEKRFPASPVSGGEIPRTYCLKHRDGGEEFSPLRAQYLFYNHAANARIPCGHKNSNNIEIYRAKSSKVPFTWIQSFSPSPEIIPSANLKCFLEIIFLGIYVYVKKKRGVCFMPVGNKESWTVACFGHPSTAMHFTFIFLFHCSIMFHGISVPQCINLVRH